MTKRILLFKKNTLCPMPHGYWTRVDGAFLVKLWQMKPWEDELWQLAIRILEGDDATTNRSAGESS